MTDAVCGQIVVIPEDRLQSVANPVLAPDADMLKFESGTSVNDSMSEDAGIRTYQFIFKNTATDTLWIDKVTTSCSCAVATYDRMDVPPGEKGRIDVRYNPKGHPGRFERKVYVYMRGNTSPSAILRLNVSVESGKDLSGIYPVLMGKIRLRRSEVQFYRGVAGIEKCVCVNVSTEPVRLECEEYILPAVLRFRADPQVLMPGQEGKIRLEYNPSAGDSPQNMVVMMKGLGVPPMQAAVKVKLK